MDKIILLTGLSGFIFFYIFHLLLFRLENHKVLKVLIYSTILAEVSNMILLYILVHGDFLQKYGLPAILIAVLISSFIYILLCFSYVLTVFGVCVTSIRIQMLCEIAKTRGRGVSEVQMLKKYNKNDIVRTRLSRLIGSGEIKKEKNFYYPNKKISYFQLHTYLLILIRRLYPHPQRQNI